MQSLRQRRGRMACHDEQGWDCASRHPGRGQTVARVIHAALAVRCTRCSLHALSADASLPVAHLSLPLLSDAVTIKQ